MNCEIIAVGTELLLGQVTNTNAQFLSQELAKIGINVYHQTTVGDNEDRMYETFVTAFKRADMIIVTGGLGPTVDDITKDVLAKVFNKKLVFDQKCLDNVMKYFQHKKFTENNKRQAYILEGSKILFNEYGTAPAVLHEDEFDGEQKIAILLPGPPREVKGIYFDHVLPYLQTKSDHVLYSKDIRIFGIGESTAEDSIKHLLETQTNPTIAPYASLHECSFRITASEKTIEEAKKLVDEMSKKLYDIFGENIYGENDDSLPSVVVKILIEKNITIALAESCTGGMVTSEMVGQSGVSKVLLESAVTYSNEAKMTRLGVKEETLKKFGAVSKETVHEMAKGIKEKSGAMLGVSISGIAGPNSDDTQKPVGLVHIGVYYYDKFYHKEVNLKGDREKIRIATTKTTLDFIRRIVLNYGG